MSASSDGQRCFSPLVMGFARTQGGRTPHRARTGWSRHAVAFPHAQHFAGVGICVARVDDQLRSARLGRSSSRLSVLLQSHRRSDSRSVAFTPLPTFTFGVWLTGLSLAIVALALLAPFAFQGRVWLKVIAYPYGVIMLLNGVQHIAASLYLAKPMPGVWSSPFLLISSVALLVATRRATRAAVGIHAGMVDERQRASRSS